MLRSVRMLAACSAMMLMAAETGSGSGGGQTGAEGETGDLVAALAAMTEERDAALAAGETAIKELQAKIDDMIAAAGKDRDRHDAALKKMTKERDQAVQALDRARSNPTLALEDAAPKDRSSEIAEHHYVLQTSRVDDGEGGSLARGRVVTVSAKRAGRMAGKIRPAKVSEVEAARQPIVHLA